MLIKWDILDSQHAKCALTHTHAEQEGAKYSLRLETGDWRAGLGSESVSMN